MIKTVKIIAIIACFMALFGVITPASISEDFPIKPGFFGEINRKAESIVVEIEPEEIPLGEVSALVFAPLPTASGTNVNKNSKAEIDYSNISDGYVMARYLEKANKELRVIINCPSGASYTYTLNSKGNYEVFPLSEGNGNYQVCIYEKIKGSKYSTVASVSFKVALKDAFTPFLRPNQYVNYTGGSETVKRATDITKNASGLVDKISAVYKYVTENIKYDKQLAATVQSGYLTDVDAVLKSGKGICFDYAVVMTTMLRTQQIPTKLVVGYWGNSYHSWISVYSKETGWVNDVISFDGSTWVLMDPTFAANKAMGSGLNATSYVAKFIY